METKKDSMKTADRSSASAASTGYASGVYCCEKRENCQWQGIVLHLGLAWGTVPTNTGWREWHDHMCGGKLIQLVLPEA